MTEPKPETPSAATDQEPKNPGIPDDLWSVMSAEERADSAANARITTSAGELLTGIPDTRTGLADIGIKAAAESIGHLGLDLTNIQQGIAGSNEALDRIREDAKAIHAVSMARQEKLMWRIVWEQTVKQREADKSAQRWHNIALYLLSLASILLSAVSILAHLMRK